MTAVTFGFSFLIVLRIGCALVGMEKLTFLSEYTMLNLRDDTQFLISNFLNKFPKH